MDKIPWCVALSTRFTACPPRRLLIPLLVSLVINAHEIGIGDFDVVGVVAAGAPDEASGTGVVAITVISGIGAGVVAVRGANNTAR